MLLYIRSSYPIIYYIEGKGGSTPFLAFDLSAPQKLRTVPTLFLTERR
jgi:hypothetical protein